MWLLVYTLSVNCAIYNVLSLSLAHTTHTCTHSHPHPLRDTIVSSLGGVALAAQETEEDIHQEGTIAMEITGVIPSSEIANIGGR